ncbi:Flp pilus assembly protein CpaB [Geomonas sp. Red32]|uniref:Flp pilus assembly protein CpaB n=1 Tax=Geomonas sp. Red32 TaxID=2912856 RepID=UPI00202CC0BE|nr:Flp pilus assembly protein CpaB [Geomonas sp. Red32]MCM0083900.1 Flp pilus assembly protein CpaB [Geomonas sp. Red32]
MTRPRTLTIVTLSALLLASCAALLAYSFLTKQTGKPYQGVPTVSAAEDLPIGSRLDASRVKLANWPKDSLPPGSYRDPKAVAGRVLVRPLGAGDIVTENKLMPLNVAGGVMTYLVPQGHRAVTVAVNEVAGVAGFVAPNSRVDVVLTTPRPWIKDDPENISKIILQNIPVLATGQVTEQKEGKAALVPTVTLDLLPPDAEKLIVGAKKGTLQLLLRNVIDVAATDTTGATLSKALGTATVQARPPKTISRAAAPHRMAAAPIKAATPPPQPMFTVEIIKGGAKSAREFAQQ